MSKSTIHRINGITITILCLAAVCVSLSLWLNEKINVVCLVAVGLLMIGIIFLDVSLITYLTRRKFCTEEVSATCVEIQEHYDYKMKQDLYRPVWEYYMDGEMRRVTNDVWFNRGVPNVGDKTTIIIDPENNDQYYQGKRFGTSNLVFLLVGLGSLMTGIGVMAAGILIGNLF